MDWDAIQDLMDHAKVVQERAPLSNCGCTIWIPIELMQKALDYAKEICLVNIELKDLDDYVPPENQE